MIIEAFNLVFIVYLLFIVIAIIGLWLSLRNTDINSKKRIIIMLCIFNIIFFFIYKIFLSFDKEFLEISSLENFSWWSELPLQLCNINMFIIPLSLLFDKKILMGFSFFIAPLGAIMAILFPENAFTGYNIFLMRNIGFYVTHGVIIISAISLCTLGFFKPKFKDIPNTFLALGILSLFMHGFNTLLRFTVCPHANYFFTYPADISLLQLFYTWLSVPYLYLIFGVFILVIYTMIITIPFELKKDYQ